MKNIGHTKSISNYSTSQSCIFFSQTFLITVVTNGILSRRKNKTRQSLRLKGDLSSATHLDTEKGIVFLTTNRNKLTFIFTTL